MITEFFGLFKRCFASNFFFIAFLCCLFEFVFLFVCIAFVFSLAPLSVPHPPHHNVALLGSQFEGGELLVVGHHVQGQRVVQLHVARQDQVHGLARDGLVRLHN